MTQLQGQTMQIVQCERWGSHTDLVIKQVPVPGPLAANEVRVNLQARGISFSDLVRIKGDYQDTAALPFTVGGEAAGTIIEVGSSVIDLRVGDRVLSPGGCVEQINVAAQRVSLLPPNVDLAVAAAFRSNYATAYYGLQLANLQPGETLLVHGAAGGVGLAAVDLGKLFGARVIGAASTDAKRGVVTALGADHVIDSTTDFRDEVKHLTAGLGADVIFDPVGGEVFDQSLRCIAPFGRILVVGFTSGRPAVAKTNHLLVKDASVIGFTIGGLQRHRPMLAEKNAATLLGWLASRRIRPFISHQLPMEDIVEAYQLLVDRQVAGKVILTSHQDNPAD